MSTTGISPGGQGGNIQPTQRDIETTAWTEINKKFWLAILPADSLEVIPFTQQTYAQKFKYDASASKPTLIILEQLRVSVEPDVVSSEGWTAVYDDLLKQLEERFPDLSKRLQELTTIPFDKRDPELVVFNNALVLIAKGVAWMEVATHPPEENSSAAMLYQMYLALPFMAIRGAINIGEGVITNVENLLKDVGPNFPLFDQATNIANEMQKLVSKLNTLRAKLESGQLPENAIANLQELASEMSKMKDKIARSGLGDELKILNTMTQAMTTAISSLALSSGSPSLLLSLGLAANGIHSSESQAGIIGKNSQMLLESVLNSALSQIEQGTGSTIKEMQALRDELNNLRNGGG